MKLNFIIIMISIIAMSCRGTTSKEPPIHLLQNMDDVGRLDPQSSNAASYIVDEEPFEDLNENGHWDFSEPFDDLNENGHWDPSYIKYISKNKMSMLKPVENTVPRDDRKSNISDIDVVRMIKETTGKYKGEYVTKIPSKYTQDSDFINRGEERYNIYCSVCHGRSGDGEGAVMSNEFSWDKNVKPANLQDLRDKDDSCKDGYLFDVISNGKARMKGYSDQISVEDRWKIVAYVRALSAANGVRISCCDSSNYNDLYKSLKNIPTLNEKLLSDEFECLIELGKVQKVFGNQMKEIQQIINCDAYDGQWGPGTMGKWAEWKEGIFD